MSNEKRALLIDAKRRGKNEGRDAIPLTRLRERVPGGAGEGRRFRGNERLDKPRRRFERAAEKFAGYCFPPASQFHEAERVMTAVVLQYFILLADDRRAFICLPAKSISTGFSAFCR
jgi:hypothetical protein